MTLKELLISCNINAILPYVVKHDRRQEGMEAHYKMAYDWLCGMEAEASDGVITVGGWSEEDRHLRVENLLQSPQRKFWEKKRANDVMPS